jgi:hypothetical protein
MDAERLPPIGRPFQRGDAIRITCDGRTVDGVVMLASDNGRSVVISFEALLLGHLGMMPVVQENDGSFSALISGAPVAIELIKEETR